MRGSPGQERTCQLDGCEKTWIETRVQRRYCSAECRVAAHSIRVLDKERHKIIELVNSYHSSVGDNWLSYVVRIIRNRLGKRAAE